jgi:hypothetical protein
MINGKKIMVITVISVTSWYIHKTVKKKKIMNTIIKNNESLIEGWNKDFDRLYKRVTKISRLRTKRKVKEMLKLNKNKQ